MVMEVTQMGEIMVMEEVEMVTVETGKEILDKGSDGNQNNRSSAGNQQTLNNDYGGNRYRTNSSDSNNFN